MLPGDKLICLFISDIAEGLDFIDWPLHVTITPWFRTSLSSDQLSSKLAEALSNIITFDFQSGAIAWFGGRRNKEVNLIQHNTELEQLELKVRSLVKSSSYWLVDETTKRPRHFRPHVTVQGSQRFREGDIAACRAVYLVEQLGDRKQVIQKLELSGG